MDTKQFSLVIILCVTFSPTIGWSHETPVNSALAVMHPTKSNKVRGSVSFHPTTDGVRVKASLSGLTPGGKHGFHVHQFGDCTALDGKSAGGHFAGEGMKHGAPHDEQRHQGDLGNIMAKADGTADVDFVDKHLRLGGKNSILGRSVIIHAGADDLKSQPSGAAGPRIACGVIGVTPSS